MKQVWWIYVAAVMAVMQVVTGVGNLIEDDGGPLWGQLVFLGVMVGGAVLIAAGVLLRPRNRRRGDVLIAVGVLPSVTGVAFLWFPPAVAYGVLAAVVAVISIIDSGRSRHAVNA